MPALRGRGWRVLWIALGALGGVAVFAFIAIVVSSSVNSVSVTFVNDTASRVVLTDCGPDLVGVAARTSAVVNVFQPTAYCSISVSDNGSSESARCLKMPRPLKNGTSVRISDASTLTRPCF